MNAIEANLDDLQSGLEAGSRVVGHIQKSAVKVDDLLARQLATAHLAGSLVREARELTECLNDQRAALVELRTSMTRLRAELKTLLKR
jgi:hypothetical protein